MNAKYKNFGYSASAMKREIILMAGEWLERASLKRGRNNDDPVMRVEGVPEKNQLPHIKAPVILNAVGEPAVESPGERAA